MSSRSSNFVLCLTCGLAAMMAIPSAEGFSTSSVSTMVAPSDRCKTGGNHIKFISSSSSSSLRMSSAQDEIAKLREAAAKAREDAARLSKVRSICYKNLPHRKVQRARTTIDSLKDF